MPAPTTWNANRITNLPIVVAGPILRKVDSGSVSVWVATNIPGNVVLDIYEGTSVLMSSPSAVPTPLVPHLCVYMLTATGLLVEGKVYKYNHYCPG